MRTDPTDNGGLFVGRRALQATDPRPERYRRRGITFVPGRGAVVTAQPV